MEVAGGHIAGFQVVWFCNKDAYTLCWVTHPIEECFKREVPTCVIKLMRWVVVIFHFWEIPLDPWSPPELQVFWSLHVRFSSGKRSYSFSQARGNTLHRRAMDGLFLWRKMLIIDLLSKVAFSWVGGLWWAVFPLLKLTRRWRQAGEKSMCKQMGSTLASCRLLFQCCLEKLIS